MAVDTHQIKHACGDHRSLAGLLEYPTYFSVLNSTGGALFLNSEATLLNLAYLRSALRSSATPPDAGAI